MRHPGLRLTIDHLGGRGGNATVKDDAAMERPSTTVEHRPWHQHRRVERAVG